MSPLISRSHVLTFPAFPTRQITGAEHAPYIEYKETLDVLGNKGPGVGAQWLLESFNFLGHMEAEAEGAVIANTIEATLNLTLKRCEQTVYVKNAEYGFIQVATGEFEYGFVSLYEQFVTPILLLPGEPLTLTMRSRVSFPITSGEAKLPQRIRASWGQEVTSEPASVGGMMYSVENYEQLGAGPKGGG
jgi:hypothetical protein